MQQLEEEALMEQCIEAMLEDEREIHNIHNQVMAANGVGVLDVCQPWSTGTDYVHPTKWGLSCFGTEVLWQQCMSYWNYDFKLQGVQELCGQKQLVWSLVLCACCKVIKLT